MRMLNMKLLIKVFVLIYILTDPPSVVANRRRSRTHRKTSSVESDNSILDGSQTRHYQSNDFADDDDSDDDYGPDEFTNFSTSGKDVDKVRRKRIDPKGSWLTFVNRLGENKPEKRKKKRKRNRKSNNNILLGPPGPAGPPGPPGSPGKSVSKEEIIKELEDLIKAEAERRAQQMLADMIPLNGSSTFIQQPDMTSPVFEVPRIYAGFSLRLGSKTRVLRKTFMEIKSFQQTVDLIKKDYGVLDFGYASLKEQKVERLHLREAGGVIREKMPKPFGEGAFQRGETFNAKEGRFSAPKDGLYQFTASLHIRLRNKRKLKGRPKPDEHLKVVICLDSLCKTNTSIETVTGVNIDNKIFTASVNGFLQLKEKQYASLYVDNSSSYNVLVMAGSEFSGIFLGT